MTPKYLEIAFAELWPMQIRETPGPRHNPRILEYHEMTTLRATEDEVAWCSAFVCWCVERAGLSSTRSARARSWLSWGVPSRYPAHGSIVVLRRAGGTEGPEVLEAPGHVGFVVGLAQASSVTVLGGNQSNSVSIYEYPLGQALGFRLPPANGGGA